MSDWPVGLSTGCFYRKSLFECLEPIRHSGFSLIEVCSFPAHLDYHDQDAVRRASGLLNDLGMEAYSFHAPFAESIDITSPDNGVRRHAVDEILRAAEAAALLQVGHFVIHPGPEHSDPPAGEERFRRLEHAAASLNEIAGRCHDLGMSCVLENKLPHLMFGDTRDILWILGAMRTIHAGTCLDTGHAWLAGDLYHVMHKLSGHLRMVHASDNSGNTDDHLPPGEGRIDWSKFLGGLSEVGFRGSIILELAGHNDTDIDSILAGARRGRSLLRSISRGLAVTAPPTVRMPRQ
ncbi:MAG TPA: sugar phosphate isomerase/epimerase family protein [Methylomirabilota bacterium]|nr:sugar phosphate isomerase/epimerase family protein [Methylomirabilota bacterium]